MCVSAHPFSVSAAETALASGASIEAVTFGSGRGSGRRNCRTDRETDGSGGLPWGQALAFACIFAVEPHPKQPSLRFQLLCPIRAVSARRPCTPSVTELRKFYSRPLGGMVRRLLTQRIRARWRNTQARPADRVRLCGALHRHVPRRGRCDRRADAGRPGRASLAGLRTPCSPSWSMRPMLPLPDASVDCLLCVHGLETSAPGGRMLREMWRVLAPEGQLLLWSQTGAGCGRASTPRRSATAGPSAAASSSGC